MLFSHQTGNEEFSVLIRVGLFKNSNSQEHPRVVECQFNYIQNVVPKGILDFQAHFLFGNILFP